MNSGSAVGMAKAKTEQGHGLGDLAAGLFDSPSAEIIQFVNKLNGSESVAVLVEEFMRSIRGLNSKLAQQHLFRLLAAFHFAATEHGS
jgi:hypothetical protein